LESPDFVFIFALLSKYHQSREIREIREAKRAAVRHLSSIFITLRMARGLLCSANKSRAVLGSVPRQGLLARTEKAKCGGCHYQIDSCSNGQKAAWRELRKFSPFPHRQMTTSPAV
jgi:hypothetical protein